VNVSQAAGRRYVPGEKVGVSAAAGLPNVRTIRGWFRYCQSGLSKPDIHFELEVITFLWQGMGRPVVTRRFPKAIARSIPVYYPIVDLVVGRKLPGEGFEMVIGWR